MERVRKLLKIPCGSEVRRATAWFTLWVGVPRLPLPIFENAGLNPLRFADPWVYGVLMTTVGLLLLITCWNGYRHKPVGRIVAAIAFVSWCMLAAATKSLTSFGFEITIAAILFVEVWKTGPCE